MQAHTTRPTPPTTTAVPVTASRTCPKGMDRTSLENEEGLELPRPSPTTDCDFECADAKGQVHKRNPSPAHTLGCFSTAFFRRIACGCLQGPPACICGEPDCKDEEEDSTPGLVRHLGQGTLAARTRLVPATAVRCDLCDQVPEDQVDDAPGQETTSRKGRTGPTSIGLSGFALTGACAALRLDRGLAPDSANGHIS